MGIKQLDQFGEVRQRPRQTVDLVDHDDVDLAGTDIGQPPLTVGSVGGPARVPAIVIAGSDQRPAGMSLTLDIGGGSIVLRVQRVELLVEPMLGRDPRIDRTADRSDGWSLHGRASVRRSIFSIPEAEEARTVPLGACDGEGDLGEAVIGLAVPGKAVSHHHHPLRLSIPFPDQNRAWIKLSSLLVKAGQAVATFSPHVPFYPLGHELARLVVE